MGRKIRRFIKKYWKVLLVIGIIIILLIIICGVIKSFSKKNPGVSGVIRVDGAQVKVYPTKDIAAMETNKIISLPKERKITANGFEKVEVTGRHLTQDGDKYILDLTGLRSGTNVILKIREGGDGSWTGILFKENVQTYYLAFSVQDDPKNHPNTTNSNNVSTATPTGTVYFDNTKYHTYASENEAQQAIADSSKSWTIPTNMVTNGLQLRAEPGENTTRIRVSVCLVDTEPIDGKQTLLNADNNWSSIIDISPFAGHQVTLMLHAEGPDGLSNGYSYVSFVVPNA